MTGSTPSKETPISASRVRDYLFCPHRVFLDEFGDKSRMDPESDLEKLLWERGMAHEKDALDQLGLVVTEVEGEDFGQCEKETLRLMTGGTRLIYQGCLSTPSLRGRPDLLEKTQGESKFGSYHYVPVEMKSGSAYLDEEAGTIKEDYVLQLSLYADLLHKVQGVKPKIGNIIDGDLRRVSVKLEPHEPDYQQCLSEIADLLSGKTESEPCIGGICKQCHWWSFCYSWAKERDDVTLIYRLNRPKRDSLRLHGIRTVQALAGLAKAKTLPDIDGISQRALQRFVRRANVLLSGKPVLHSPIEFPKAKLELFFDIETDPLGDICYLYGIVERRGNARQRYVSFFADSPEEEQRTWDEFWQYVAKLKDFQVYHYSSYEKTFLTRLRERYGCNQTLFDDFLQHCTDLYFGAVERCSDWPSHSYSIKLVSQCLGFDYSEEEPGGIKAAMWYIEYVKDPVTNRALKDKIIQYNREDCEAMIVLKDWVVEKNRELRR